jgi:hypothetical protein
VTYWRDLLSSSICMPDNDVDDLFPDITVEDSIAEAI